MRMQKRLFRIGDLAEKLSIEKFVIRFWEKEFNVKTHRSHGGQRFYSIEDFEQFQKIKSLLYERGFTIAGAKKELCNELSTGSVNTHGARKTTMEQEVSAADISDTLKDKLIHLRHQLIKLKKHLK